MKINGKHMIFQDMSLEEQEDFWNDADEKQRRTKEMNKKS